MGFVERLDNIYTIDAKMFGFRQYCAAFLVKGQELALIDTGLASQTEALFSGIREHGFALNDISYIFLTHTHGDHAGNVANVLKESPGAYVYIHPEMSEFLTDPVKEVEKRKELIPLSMVNKIGTPEPTPPSRIRFMQDGEVFDLGNGESLQVIYAPGHQPTGVVFFEKKHKGLFINDLVGNYLADANIHYQLNPYRSDHLQAIESLKKLMELPVKNLYLGHYGIITTHPKEVISRAIDQMQELLDIGARCLAEGKPEKIADQLWALYTPQIEKLRNARGEEAYQYAITEHLPAQFRMFTEYCQDHLTE